MSHPSSLTQNTNPQSTTSETNPNSPTSQSNEEDKRITTDQKKQLIEADYQDAIAKRDRANLQEKVENQLTGKALEADNARIRITIEGLFNVSGNYLFYISGKPQTVGCDDALRFRYAPPKDLSDKNDQGSFGSVTAEHEIKSMVMKHNDGTIYYFLMPGDKNLDNDIMRISCLKKADLESMGIIAYTVNPATVLALAGEKQKVKVFVHEDLEKANFLTNNCGSRNLSYTISQDHFQEMMAQLALKQGVEMHKYDGSFADFKIKNLQISSGISPEQILNLVGDHGRHR
jgi:prolyl-tRNA editing enzyme YbaK/EbsC (Cys-tRNA(Pro) deacylase)